MSLRKRRSRGPSPAAYVLGAAVLVATGIGLLWYQSRDATEPEPPPTPVAEGQPAPEPTPDIVPPLALPGLSASDAFVRALVATLSEHPQVARWLVTDELVQRFVVSVVDVAGGLSPRSHVEFLIPEEELTIRASGEALVVEPASFARYDLLTEIFISLDTEGTARLYHQLHPLFDEAYAELGIQDGTFDDAMALAVGNLLSARIPSGPLEVRPNEAVYEFIDPALESRSPVEKHLIRMGPENAARMQAKLRELRDAIATLTAGPA